MTRKKVFAVFALLLLGLVMLQLRLFVLMNDAGTAEAAALQSTRSLVLARERPDFYDMNGVKLTGATETTLAVVYPKTADGYALLEYVPKARQQEFFELMEGSLPFALELETDAGALSNDCVSVSERGNENSLCSHLIGSLDASGGGASGLEYALDGYLSANSSEIVLTVDVNAQGAKMLGEAPVIERRGARGAGVYLTIDSRVQRAAQNAESLIERGAVVVLDAESAEIRAMASFPNYDSGNIAQYLKDERLPLFNRALAAYNVGSIYKPVLAASALTARAGGDFSYTCFGEIEVNGQSYTCNDSTAHGELNMREAIVRSCNSYFIALGNELGAGAIYNTACSLKLNLPLEICEKLSSRDPSFPSLSALESISELNNHCFGQGRLTLTPLHIAAYTCCIASGGNYKTPSLILNIGGIPAEKGLERQAFSEESAKAVAGFMQEAVERGTGANARPTLRSAAGKTGTAQTGKYNADGGEKTVGWFTGWFPAEEPKYIITVMTEDGGYGFESAAPVFRQIADELVSLGLA